MRCFIAIALPAAIREALAALQIRLQSLGRAVRWVPPERIHLTIKFLGEVEEGQVTAVRDAITSVAARYTPFELAVSGTGCFPPTGRVRVIWTGIPDLPPPLLACQQEGERVWAQLGFAPETRRFRPHLTLGRVREDRSSGRIRAVVEQQGDFTAGRFLANELILFQSVLLPTGPTYTVLARAPLGQQD